MASVGEPPGGERRDPDPVESTVYQAPEEQQHVAVKVFTRDGGAVALEREDGSVEVFARPEGS